MSSKHPPREVAVFVHRLLRRARSAPAKQMSAASLRDYWHVVAGALEQGETYAEAAARELREETGLDATPNDLGLEQTYAITERERPLYPEATAAVVIANFEVEAPADWEPELNEEHDRHEWATPDAARAMMYWVETQEAIDLLAQKLAIRPR